MAQATPKRAPASYAVIAHFSRSLREAGLYVCTAIAAYLLLSLASYDPNDTVWSYAGTDTQVANLGGSVGAWTADFALSIFGYLAYLFPLAVGYGGWALYRWRPERLDGLHVGLCVLGFLLVIGAGAGLATLHTSAFSPLPLMADGTNAGGILGFVIGHGLKGVLSPLGATLLLTALFLAGVTLASGLSWLHLLDFVGDLTLRVTSWGTSWGTARLAGLRAPRFLSNGRGSGRLTALIAPWRQPATAIGTDPDPAMPPPEGSARERIEPVLRMSSKLPIDNSPSVDPDEPPQVHERPWALPLDLLDPPEPARAGFSSLSLEEMARQVELRLKDFAIEVRVVAIRPGPVITRFELQPAPGLKASRITNLSRDLARALRLVSVRVVEVIPGKSVIGLEIPNEHREIVRLREILTSEVYAAAGSPLTLALGKGVSGQPVVADLARMPHLLVAGTTGSGKSVAVNAMILSLVFNASPDEVRLIMVDPKMLELSVYERIPHLLAPVVTDMKEAANALRWCVAEMDRRYKLMAALGVRNLAGYNRKVRDAIAAGSPIPDPLSPAFLDETPRLAPMPFIVVIVDELADLMMVVGKKVEELIARLAQKARAAGIHLVLATQRPSVDVITGLIKANIPTRMAFQVSSRVDSRTILDQMGAEQLLGQGDMLFLPPGTGIPARVHGAFVADHEVHTVVRHLRTLGPPDYVAEVLRDAGEAETGDGPREDFVDAESDPLYDQAVRIVLETRRASISGVQRRLKIGYNRAARMIEAMEHAGLVGPLLSNGSREVLVPVSSED